MGSTARYVTHAITLGLRTQSLSKALRFAGGGVETGSAQPKIPVSGRPGSLEAGAAFSRSCGGVVAVPWVTLLTMACLPSVTERFAAQ